MIGLLTIGSGLMTIGGGLAAKASSKRAASRARGLKIQAENRLNELEANRQAIINPFAGVTDLTSMAKDLSGMVSNPFANLGVATQAAEIQIEEADIALANTLDTLRATGGSAGGATALAQAALKSKKGVSANIEAQEAQNEKLAAQGQQQMEQLKMQETARIQGIGISEGQRIQGAEAQGKQFMFGAQEGRDMQSLNRQAGLADRYAQQEMASMQGAQAANSAMLSGLGSLTGSVMGAYGTFKGANPEGTYKQFFS